jgi:hypothetical protein
MDPIANIQEQIRLANKIQTQFDREDPVSPHDAARLAELVLAFAEWNYRGGAVPHSSYFAPRLDA